MLQFKSLNSFVYQGLLRAAEDQPGRKSCEVVPTYMINWLDFFDFEGSCEKSFIDIGGKDFADEEGVVSCAYLL